MVNWLGGGECNNFLALGRTYDTLSEWRALEGGQAQITDLNGAGGTGDEDVVALKVPVNDGRSPGVEEVQALQDLSAPAP